MLADSGGWRPAGGTWQGAAGRPRLQARLSRGGDGTAVARVPAQAGEPGGSQAQGGMPAHRPGHAWWRRFAV